MNLVSGSLKIPVKTQGTEMWLFFTSVKTTSVRDKSVELKRNDRTQFQTSRTAYFVSEIWRGNTCRYKGKSKLHETEHSCVMRTGRLSLAGRDKGRRESSIMTIQLSASEMGLREKRHIGKLQQRHSQDNRAFAYVERRIE